MKTKNRYPVLNIRNKKEFAQRLTSKNFKVNDALKLIDDVLENYNKYWKDNIKESDIDKEKYIRSAAGTPLGKLLRLIDKKILAPYDKSLPEFIFGGVSNRDHVKAAAHLLGKKKNRTLLELDIKRFFEQNKKERVSYFLHGKCGCTKKISDLIAGLCCVPVGPKGLAFDTETIARGFATSTRLATWVNLDLLLRSYWLAKKILKGSDMRMTIFVDDLGVTASEVNKATMEELSFKIGDLFDNYDRNHKISLNPDKIKIKQSKEEQLEHLGIKLGRKKLSFGKKTQHNINVLNNKLQTVNNLTKEEKRKLFLKKKSYARQKAYFKKQTKQ